MHVAVIPHEVESQASLQGLDLKKTVGQTPMLPVHIFCFLFCVEFNSVHFIAQYHKLRIWLRGLDNLNTSLSQDLTSDQEKLSRNRKNLFAKGKKA